jgi:RNA polymerase sigma-70 factor (ECF subfamily)
MDQSAATIARWIRLAREGQADALGTLLGAYRNYLRLMARACLDRDLRGKADPSDVAQDTLLKAHEHFQDFRGTTEQEWIAWVRKILTRNLADLHRRFTQAARQIDHERSLEAVLDRSSLALRNLVGAPGPSPSDHAHRREVSVVLADALAQLEPEDREVIVLRHLEELEWEQIGDRTGRSAGAARMMWTRALKRVGGLLKERLS